MARGHVTEDSDLDILVMSGFAPEDRHTIRSWMEDIAMEHEIPIDIAFADLSPELARDSIPCR